MLSDRVSSCSSRPCQRIRPVTNRRIAMTTLRRRMFEDLQLRGLAPKTQQCDVEAVHHLAQHYRRAPTSSAKRRSVSIPLSCSMSSRSPRARSVFTSMGSGSSRDAHGSDRGRSANSFGPGTGQTLPVVLSPQEVRPLLAVVERPKARMCLRTITRADCDYRKGPSCKSPTSTPHRMLVQVRQRHKAGKTASCRWPPDPGVVAGVLAA